MSRGGCCSFHYRGWREKLNRGIDKRLKKKKRIEGWWEEENEIFSTVFLHHRGCREGEKVIENKLRKREKRRWERSTIEKGSPGCCWFFKIIGLLLIFFASLGCRFEIKKERGKKRREEHHWEGITGLLLIFQDHRATADFFYHWATVDLFDHRATADFFCSSLGCRFRRIDDRERDIIFFGKWRLIQVQILVRFSGYF